MISEQLKKRIPVQLRKLISGMYCKYLYNKEVRNFDRYRKRYDTYDINKKISLTNEWAGKFPEQKYFKYSIVELWLRDHVSEHARILEIGGWRGDLALICLAEDKSILYWHNYDLLKRNDLQKCSDPRYRLITLDDYLWNKHPDHDYNALIATHMIEHIKWRELKELIRWIPGGIKTVLFEAPLPASAENIDWKGDHSSHILEKGWEQIAGEMKINGFSVDYSADNTYIFGRK